jgi:hypothetical protein
MFLNSAMQAVWELDEADGAKYNQLFEVTYGTPSLFAYWLPIRMLTNSFGRDRA